MILVDQTVANTLFYKFMKMITLIEHKDNKRYIKMKSIHDGAIDTYKIAGNWDRTQIT